MADEKTQVKTIEYISVPILEKISPGDFQKEWMKNVSSENQWSLAQFYEEFVDETLSNFSNNLEAIWAQYDEKEKVLYKDEYAGKSLPYIKPGTEVLVKISGIHYTFEEQPKVEDFLEQSGFSAYFPADYKSIVSDPTFVPNNQTIDSKIEESGLSVTQISVNVKVYLYSNALDKVYDVSMFVASMTTSKTKKKGEFSLTLTPNYTSTVMDLGGTTLLQFAQLGAGKYQTKSFFEKFLQYNDVVFIRFERLKIEGDEKTEFNSEKPIEVPKNKASDAYWDMIGFVDNCNVAFDASSSTTLVTLTGRDFSKFFEEDGSYFLPLQTIDTSTALNWPMAGNSPVLKRNLISGSFEYLWTYGFKGVKDTVWFVINAMSNIAATSGSFFDQWKGARTSPTSLEGQETFPVNGVWKILQVYIDSNLDKRVYADTSIGNPNGTMMEYMDKFVQYPFMEYYFDTYINTVNLTVRQPPTTRQAIEGAYADNNYVNISASSIIAQSLSYDDRYYSWYEVNLSNSWAMRNDSTQRAFIPIVYLNEYAKMWGNRRLQIQDIYLLMRDVSGDKSDDKKGSLATFTAALMNDLIYLIESNSYLPFTRKGTITLIGDRRIKVGTFVLNEYTNEFFLVTGVVNTVSFTSDSIVRETVLSVERGMYVPCLAKTSPKAASDARKDNAKGTSAVNSYFDIVKLDTLRQLCAKAAAGEFVSWENEVLVDPAVFDYFLKRKMYGE